LRKKTPDILESVEDATNYPGMTPNGPPTIPKDDARGFLKVFFTCVKAADRE
jgi:hypothetical protein